ncbi:MAG TPA: type II CAAX endopeptidase family protein [Tissierellaceae bacterium]|nr:type II CAAX endopeptidase family protein [Tissierellaceae bacterium]
MEKRIKPSILEANIIYLILAIGLLFIGSYVQSREIYSGLLITEYILILLPILLYLKLRRYSLKKVLRLNKISFRQIIIVIIITVFTYPIAVFVQTIFINIITSFKDVVPTEVPIPDNGPQYLVSIFIIAISPGICEEVMFRGLMLDAYESIGRKKSIMISAILFAIFHFTFLNLLGPFILGIVFGIMVYQTNSIYSSIIGHIVNNSLALTIGYYINKYQYLIDDMIDQQMVSSNGSNSMMSSLFILGILVLSLLIVITLLKKLSEDDFYEDEREELYMRRESYIKKRPVLDKLQYIPILIVTVLFIIINLALILF